MSYWGDRGPIVVVALGCFVVPVYLQSLLWDSPYCFIGTSEQNSQNRTLNEETGARELPSEWVVGGEGGGRGDNALPRGWEASRRGGRATLLGKNSEKSIYSDFC